jgi:hypothetical protein
MDICPLCKYPLTWSDDQAKVWCAIYGDHGTGKVQAERPILFGEYRGLVKLCMNTPVFNASTEKSRKYRALKLVAS